MARLLVATERLGWPGRESGRLERWGLVQRKLQYPTQPNDPTATCHLMVDESTPALCGYEWEGLVAVPGAPGREEFDPELRCEVCEAALGVDRASTDAGPYKFSLGDPPRT